ncbi:hypothetical protein MF1_06220 [Bartonella quintana]|nr:hypothetical protein MF1_06220 [Bartonella quintana]
MRFANGKADKGKSFGHRFYEVEVKWLMEKEWAKTCDDVLCVVQNFNFYLIRKKLMLFLPICKEKRRLNKVYDDAVFTEFIVSYCGIYSHIKLKKR